MFFSKVNFYKVQCFVKYTGNQKDATDHDIPKLTQENLHF